MSADLSPELAGMVIGKLQLVYGRRFTSQYDNSPEELRAFWAHELAGVSEQGIRYALERLPQDYAPNVLQLRALAACRPTVDAPRLPAPKARDEIKRPALEQLQGLAPSFTGPRDPLAWAERIAANPQAHCLYARKMALQVLKERGRIG